jgi:hypothetical protein
MNLSEICIYGYLSILAVCAIAYGIVVVSFSNMGNQPLRVNSISLLSLFSLSLSPSPFLSPSPNIFLVGLPVDIWYNNTMINGLVQLENITNGYSPFSYFPLSFLPLLSPSLLFYSH